MKHLASPTRRALFSEMWTPEVSGNGEVKVCLLDSNLLVYAYLVGAKWWLYPGYFNASNPQSEVPPEEGWQISVGKQPAPSVQLVMSRE